MSLKNILTKLNRKEMITVQKFKPVFTTVDGNTHIGFEYKYGIADRLRCSVPEYIMIDVRKCGYIKDHRNVMYPLGSVISIDWTLVDEKEVEDKFSAYDIFVAAEEVNACTNSVE